ncbi:M4 family metallopeptidase [Embleya hyalina]|uniref:Peptidase M28 n=1 Tax=Embleya hyalina TaxID=516124 RepID=A0A401YEL7_9ACTN|nr:M4 family metallopeptidase [Embleya hyalina]GCD93066.1 peptidase M28 [Embleya hyalina]
MHRRTLTFGSALALLAGLVVGTTTPSNAAPPPTSPAAARAAAIDAADRAVTGASSALVKAPGERYRRAMVTPWIDNLYSIAYTRTYRGLPVVGGDAAVLADGTGRVRAVETADGPRIDDVPTEPAVPATTAEASARTRLAAVDRVDRQRLVVQLAPDAAHLAWETVLVGRNGDAPSRLHVYVDARTGAVLDAATHDAVRAGTGHSKWNGPDPITIPTTATGSTHLMRDPSRPGLSCADYGGGTLTKPVDDWGTGNPTAIETGCVDAMWAVQKQWDMLRDWLGRNGHKGTGGTYPVVVGYPDVNAYFDDTRVYIGHNTANEWIAAMDVVGHEYGHGIDLTTPGHPFTEHGLTEGTGDIFGTLTEFYADEPAPYDTPDYTIGETADIVGTGPLRYMYNPDILGHPNCYSTRIPPMEEHKATGPLNHWFHLLAEGSHPGGGKPESPTCNGSTVTGVGIKTAGRVFYGGLLLRPANTDYRKLRRITLQAAKVLDPTCGVWKSTRNAWNAVSVPANAGDPVCP